jgi:ectoine hydroxylase-related dioxygenase (phytanoyl-CoA dioxygenase family)
MSSSALQDAVARDGYVTVESVLEGSEVPQLRDVLTQAFAEPPGPHDDAVQRIDAASRYPAIRAVLERPQLLSALRAILGDQLIVLPDTVAHDSSFPTWHKDTTSMEQRGHSFQKDPRFLLVHVGLYLQDNGPYGGGLDVIPGTHRQSDPFVRRPRTRFGQIIDYRILEPLRTRNAVSVPTRAGDALVFDFRIAHRATLPTACPRDDIPREYRKLAIFLSFTGSREMAEAYRGYLIDHGGYGYLEHHQYPAEFQELARDREIILA